MDMLMTPEAVMTEAKSRADGGTYSVRRRHKRGIHILC